MSIRQSQGDGPTRNPSVYTAAAGHYKRGVRLDEEAVANSASATESTHRNGTPLITIQRDAPDYNDLFIHKGSTILPDELLAKKYSSNLEIPLQPRDEFPQDNQLPASDLLKAIHYYASAKVSGSAGGSGHPRADGMIQSMDETALLCMGKLVEEWVDDLIDGDGSRIWSQLLVKEKSSAMNWNGLGGDYGENSDANVLSSDWSLSEEDVDEEDDPDSSASLS